MPEPTDPQGPGGDKVAVRVEYVHRDAPPCQVIFLADPYGLMLHFARTGSVPCTFPAACKAHAGKPPKYHGFSPVLFRVSTHPEIWEHRVFDCSAGFCRRLEGRSIRGERWELSAPTDPATGQHPVLANFLGMIDASKLPKPCVITDELRRFFGCRELPASQPNPIPGYQHLPPVHLVTEVQAVIERPTVYVPPPPPPPPPPPDPVAEAKLDKADEMERRTRRGYNATADRLRREAAERLRMPK